MVKYSYPAVIRIEKESFWVSFPDLSGCYSCASSLEGAILEAKEALLNYCISEGDFFQRELPAATSLSEIKKAYPNDHVQMISCDSNAIDKRRNGEEVKKTIILPKWVDEQLKKQGISLNTFVNEALLERLINK